MADLIVSTDGPGSPTYCADQQKLAYEAIGKAQIEATGDKNPEGNPRYEPVWISHGCYVGAGNTALDAAVAARKEACDALIAASQWLEQTARDAAVAYEETDILAAESINKQLAAE